jgi:hypothetical protein
VLQPTESAAASHQLCATTTVVPGSVPLASKYQTDPSDWGAAWSCLKFSMNEPQYYQYQYVSADATSFSCVAKGDLDGDTVQSTFTLAGGVIGTTAKKTATYAPTIGEVNPDE